MVSQFKVSRLTLVDGDSSSIGCPAESPRVQAAQDLAELHR